jgi:hypothetical protein
MGQRKDLWENTVEKCTGSKASYICRAGRVRLSYTATPPNLDSHFLTQAKTLLALTKIKKVFALFYREHHNLNAFPPMRKPNSL